MLDINNGQIMISKDFVLYPGYSFEQFKQSHYYNNEDGVRVIYLDTVFCIDNNKFVVSLFFKSDVIYIISLVCIDYIISEKEEYKRKEVHDKIMKKNKLKNGKKYHWGNVVSKYFFG